MVRLLLQAMLFALLAITYRIGFASGDQDTRQNVVPYNAAFGYGAQAGPYPPQYVSQPGPYPSNPYEPYPYNPYPYDPYPYNPYPYDPYPYPPTKKPASGKISPLLLLLIMLMNRGTTTTTTATTTTMSPTTADTCYWSAWTGCTAVCGGIRTRTRTCSGVLDSVTERCNTATGFQADGWYRATNCYEYSWRSASVLYAAAVTECANLNSKLAAVGMRNDSVRPDVLSKLALNVGVGAGEAYIGTTRTTTTSNWVWSDGDPGTPTFFGANQPSNGANDLCAIISIGSANSLDDVDCTTAKHSYICERPVA